MGRFDETWAERWFGDGPYDLDAALLCLGALDDATKRRFGVPLYRSPGLTGALAWQKRYGGGWAPISGELQQLIRETTGQGRFECCPVTDTLPGLCCLDLRLAYAASAIALTSGQEWRREERPAGGWTTDQWTQGPLLAGGMPPAKVYGCLGWTPARYRVRFDPPREWGHVGLLPVYCGSTLGWLWPTADVPRLGGWQTWADAAEVRLAIECGWSVEVLERLYCTDEKEQRPLRSWAEALLAIRDDLCRGSAHAALYRTALRNVLLQAIGMFASRPQVETRTVASRDALPAHELAEVSYRETDAGEIEFEDYNAGSPVVQSLRHPEFAAAIWADTRVRLLRQAGRIADPSRGGGLRSETGALALPREWVVGFGLDCIYAACDPEWPDDGKAGRYRVKWCKPGPLAAPTNRRELEGMASLT